MEATEHNRPMVSDAIVDVNKCEDPKFQPRWSHQSDSLMMHTITRPQIQLIPEALISYIESHLELNGVRVPNILMFFV